MDTFEQAFTERVTGVLDTLDALILSAETAKQSTRQDAKYAQAARTLAELAQAGAEVTEHVIVSGDLAREAAKLTELADALTRATGADRGQGDALSAQVSGMLQAGITLSDEITQRASDAVTRWQSSNPGKGSKSTGGPRASTGQGQGHHIEMRCSCGWSGHDSSNPNSARWLVLGHLVKNTQSHASITVKPGKGDADHTKLTEAIYPVAKGEEGTRKSEPLTDGSVITVTRA